MMRVNTKFEINEEVWIIESMFINTGEQECPNCVDGYLHGKNGFKIPCYECGRKGRVMIRKYGYTPKKMYITGYSQRVDRHGVKDNIKDLEISESYYLMDRLLERHSVYTDSNGDYRKNGDEVYKTEEEALDAAIAQEAEDAKHCERISEEDKDA